VLNKELTGVETWFIIDQSMESHVGPIDWPEAAVFVLAIVVIVGLAAWVLSRRS